MDGGCRALLVKGGGGAGKTAAATEIAKLLTARRYPTALVDLDALSQLGPSPAPGPPPPGLSLSPQPRPPGQPAWSVQADRPGQPGSRGTVRGPMWDLQAALKAHESLAHSEDFIVRNDRPLGEVAAEILVMAGWMSGEDG